MKMKVEIEELSDNPSAFELMDEEKKNVVMSKIQIWVKENTKPARLYGKETSYGLKHCFESYSGIYLTNGQFKGAMLLLGYQPKSKKKQNWKFRLCLKKNDQTYIHDDNK
jgi:hypothetical protein